MSDQPCTSASTIAADLASAKAYNLSRRLALEASSETALETASETTSETVTVPKKSHLDEMNVNNFIYNELDEEGRKIFWEHFKTFFDDEEEAKRGFQLYLDPDAILESEPEPEVIIDLTKRGIQRASKTYSYTDIPDNENNIQEVKDEINWLNLNKGKEVVDVDFELRMADLQNELDLLNKVYPSERIRFQLAEEAKEKRKDWLRNLDTRDVVRLNLDLQIERMNLLLEDDGYEEGVEFNAKEVDAKREAARKAAQEAGEEASIRLEQLDNSSPDIIVDGSTLLQDVINGHYTMGDIAIAQGSAGNQDPIERSALQLFDNIVQYSKKHTRNILQSNDPRQFFQSLQQSGIDIQNMRPVQLDQSVESAATAIDLMSSLRTEPNEVMEACESLMKAQLMYEAEVNLKKVADISDWKRLQIHMYRKMNEENQTKYLDARDNLAIRPYVDLTISEESDAFKVAAVAEAKWLRDQDKIANLHKQTIELDTSIPRPDEEYDIFMKYDLSLLPSDDPSVYKPLEIISYMGITRPVK